MGTNRRAPVAMTVEQLVETWLGTYTSPNTRAAYGRDVRAFAAWCATDSVSVFRATTADVDRYREQADARGVSSATTNRQLSALRAFFDHAVQLGAAPTHPFPSRSFAARQPTSDTSVLSADDVRRLVEACRRSPRDAVLVHLLLGDGLRLAEAIALDHEHVVGGSRRARVVQVRRHDRTQLVTLSEATSDAISVLERAGHRRGPLLIARRGTEAQRLTRFGADFIIKELAVAAGIQSVVSANVLRRTHAVRARHEGHREDEIRLRMGHRDVRTTRRYLAGDGPAPSPSTPTTTRPTKRTTVHREEQR